MSQSKLKDMLTQEIANVKKAYQGFNMDVMEVMDLQSIETCQLEAEQACREESDPVSQLYVQYKHLLEGLEIADKAMVQGVEGDLLTQSLFNNPEFQKMWEAHSKGGYAPLSSHALMSPKTHPPARSTPIESADGHAPKI